MGISEIMSLLSGIALFLFGMSLMGDGLKKLSGSRLEPILFRLTGKPIRGVLLGTGVTAVIQSSCATSVMCVGFVNSGIMKLKQAAYVIFGAILGTSITGWIICLSYIGQSARAALDLHADRHHCRHRNRLPDVCEETLAAAGRRYSHGLCRADVRHEHDERRGR